MQYIGHLREHALMYLTPQTIPDSLTTDQLRRLFATATAGIKDPWILVINCAGANPSQLMGARRVNEVLRTDYNGYIHGTWLMNAGSLLRGAINMFLTSADEESAITFLETDRLGLFVQLQRAGCSHAQVDWFLQRLPAAKAS
jgi:hypothetical protein